MDKFENRIPFEGFGYGRNGTPTQKALEDAVAAIEGAHRSIAVQSGLGAVTGAIVGFLKAGDHMLITDNAYGPARRFANTTLKNFGVETTYFDPMIGAGIEKQPSAVRVSIYGGTNERRVSVLSAIWVLDARM